MMATAQKGFRAKTYDWVTKRWVYHSIFWVLGLTFLTVIELMGSNFGFLFIFSNNLIRLLIFALIVYFNLFYLIPNYLTKKEFLRYLALLALSVIIITPLESFILYLKFWDMPEAQATLVHDLNWSFIPNFFVAGSATIFKIITDWVRHLREKQELETQTMQSELRFLKSQINPHFLFNTLNNYLDLESLRHGKGVEVI